MLSISLIEDLARTVPKADDTDFAYYFCSYQDEKRNTGFTVLRGIIYQIIVKRPHLTKHALPYFETKERTQETLSSLESLWIIFKELPEDPGLGTIFYVIDGLDECNEGTLQALVP